MERFHLGINYWPVASAMYWWRRFDATEVAGDFTRIRAAGFESVRVFLLWEDFQPAPDQVSDEALRKLVTVADLAARNELSLVPTLFTGHMSGVNWIPPWALEAVEETARFRVVAGSKVVRAKLKNWYSDSGVMQAQALLAREVAAALARHPAIWAMRTRTASCRRRANRRLHGWKQLWARSDRQILRTRSQLGCIWRTSKKTGGWGRRRPRASVIFYACMVTRSTRTGPEARLMKCCCPFLV